MSDHRNVNAQPERPAHPSSRHVGEPSLHQVVIVGGGAAGLQLSTKLGDRLGRHKKAQVTLVERSRTHIWKPLLHEVAAGSMDVGHHAVDYLAQAHRHHFRYRIGEMVGLDREKQEVFLAASVDNEGREVTPPRSFRYETLVIAVGSGSNDFGTPGVKEHAIALDTPEQAV
jgi:NADH:ubiquinone reductase (H+-translocating)